MKVGWKEEDEGGVEERRWKVSGWKEEARGGEPNDQLEEGKCSMAVKWVANGGVGDGGQGDGRGRWRMKEMEEDERGALWSGRKWLRKR